MPHGNTGSKVIDIAATANTLGFWPGKWAKIGLT
jgi:hypothetical protein